MNSHLIYYEAVYDISYPADADKLHYHSIAWLAVLSNYSSNVNAFICQNQYHLLHKWPDYMGGQMYYAAAGLFAPAATLSYDHA